MTLSGFTPLPTDVAAGAGGHITHTNRVHGALNDLVTLALADSVVNAAAHGVSPAASPSYNAGAFAEAVAAAGPSGIVLVPPADGFYAINAPINVLGGLIGAHPAASKIRLTISNQHVLEVYADDAIVAGLTIDGGITDTFTSRDGHGIRAHGARQTYRDLVVQNCADYGLAFGQTTDSVVADLILTRVRVLKTGQDAIDIKNTGDANDNLQLSHITVSEFGKDATQTGQAGIDVRGPANLAQIRSAVSNAGGVGVRFREGENGATNGYGGHNSTLAGFRITASAADATAVYVAGRHADISGGFIRGVAGSGVGVDVVESYATIRGVRVLQALYGFRARETGGLAGHFASFLACAARTCTGAGYRFEGTLTAPSVVRSVAHGNGWGVSFNGAAVSPELAFVDFAENSSGNVQAAPASVRATSNRGWAP